MEERSAAADAGLFACLIEGWEEGGRSTTSLFHTYPPLYVHGVYTVRHSKARHIVLSLGMGWIMDIDIIYTHTIQPPLIPHSIHHPLSFLFHLKRPPPHPEHYSPTDNSPERWPPQH